MPDLKLGILLWSQATEWPPMLDAAQHIDQLGYDHVWTWDHLYSIWGAPDQPIFEGWTALAAWAVATRQVRLGLMVGANTFRNPGLFAKTAATLDHISGGRAILGIGGAWFELEHSAHGFDFGSGFGQRLDWMDESVGVMRRLLDGEEVTYASEKYRFEKLAHHPLPLQAHLPIMIGGTGEKKTLRTVAKYGDMWNGFGTPEELKRKDEVLRRHCEEVGRDEREIERTIGCQLVIRDTEEEARRFWMLQLERNRCPFEDDPSLWLGTPGQIADRIRAFRAIGFNTVVAEIPAPFDMETIERLMLEVKPMVEG